MIEVHFSFDWLLEKGFTRVQIGYFIEFRLSMAYHEGFSEAFMTVVALIAKSTSALNKVHALSLLWSFVGLSLPFHE